MKDYITTQERMKYLIIKERKWTWLRPKYNTNAKNEKRSNESKHKNHREGNNL